MTLDEYEKLLEEKRKALQALKTEERKVDTKQFETMQPLANKKKGDVDVFIKLVKLFESFRHFHSSVDAMNPISVANYSFLLLPIF